jgi:hypothetical protein
MHELKTCITCNDLFEINSLLDMKEDIKNYQIEQQNKKR